jgi:hypothetical protein
MLFEKLPFVSRQALAQIVFDELLLGFDQCNKNLVVSEIVPFQFFPFRLR